MGRLIKLTQDYAPVRASEFGLSSAQQETFNEEAAKEAIRQ